jgi:hypothetical protein
MMRVFIDLAMDTEADERVRSVCAVAVLDRAGIRPVDFDPTKEKPSAHDFNPRAYTPEQLDVIQAAPRLMLNPPRPQATERAGGRCGARAFGFSSGSRDRSIPGPLNLCSVWRTAFPKRAI